MDGLRGCMDWNKRYIDRGLKGSRDPREKGEIVRDGCILKGRYPGCVKDRDIEGWRERGGWKRTGRRDRTNDVTEGDGWMEKEREVKRICKKIQTDTKTDRHTKE